MKHLHRLDEAKEEPTSDDTLSIVGSGHRSRQCPLD